MAVGEDYADALAPGWALCHTVSSCADVGEFGRAAQWSRTMHGFSLRWSARHFFGVCRTAYGAVLATHGDWPTAEQELTSAMDDLRAARPGLAAPTAVRLGQLRVRQGRADDARRLFESALPYAQAVVAIGELDLAAGDPAAAAEAAERVLRRLGTASPLERFPALELLARARARAGAGDDAAAAVAELLAEGERLATGYLRARATLVAAEVRLQACRPRRGAPGRRGCRRPVRGVRRAVRGGNGAARAGRRARGPRTRGAGRGRGAHRARGARGAGPAPDDRGEGEALTARELDVLRLVAEGLSDAEIAGRLFLSPHTVHRHVANVRRKLGLPSRAAAVAHAAQAGLL